MAIATGHLLDNIIHPSNQRPSQHLYVVQLGEYAYAVPYVINMQKNEIF
ncbi:hypothetical protein JNM87_02885 [Candidatus Saccharibacteria bacterium]|nr:hypothetical protein [Candidatus Saccharibacteria bacterium]